MVPSELTGSMDVSSGSINEYIQFIMLEIYIPQNPPEIYRNPTIEFTYWKVSQSMVVLTLRFTSVTYKTFLVFRNLICLGR